MFQLFRHNAQRLPKTEDLFTVKFADCHFDESVYPTLGGEQKQLENEID